MNELISQLWTPELTAGLIVVIILLLILYVLSIVWVVRDAYMRGTQWYIWAIVALVPGVGLIAYLLLRPPLLQIDRDEQELEIALKQRELMRYGECATCGYPVEADYVLCPNCLTQLKNLCRTCHKALDPAWEVCPYCATPVMGTNHQRATDAARQAAAAGSANQQSATVPAQTSNPRARNVQAKAAAAKSETGVTANPSSAATAAATSAKGGATAKAKGRSKRQSQKTGADASAAKAQSTSKSSGAQGQQKPKASSADAKASQKNNPRAAQSSKSQS